MPSSPFINPIFATDFHYYFHSVAKMKDAGKSHKENGKSSSLETRKDRKSATGMNGSPKKGGHGGKFTWIGHGYSEVELGLEDGALDAKDPNFEDPSD